ncbi:phosphotransferase [Lentzea sp. NPDC042327]|uniref:phosphotransferase n=1 Tax=Lentzea sp. NPDC042327 TaxID=3154801 RepID=UPI0033EEBEF5
MITNNFLDAVLDHYGLAGKPVEPLNQGADNFTASVNSEFVLRCYRVTPAEEVDVELDLIDHLVERGFPTPRVLRTADGARRVEHEGTHAVLFELVPGSPIDEDAPASRRTVAELAASLHLATADLPAGARRSRSDRGRIQNLLAELDAGGPLATKAGASELAGELRTLLSEVDDLLGAGLPHGAVHHDYYHENVLVDAGGRVLGLIDFDEAYPGPVVLDVAALLTTWATDDEDRFDTAAMRSLLADYERVRPLSDRERAALPLAVRVFNAADAAEYIQRNHRKRPDAFEIAECRSLQTYHALTSQHDWLRGFATD